MIPREIESRIEKYLRAKPDQRRQAYRDLMKQLKDSIKNCNYDEAALILHRMITPMLDYSSCVSLYGIYKKLQKTHSIPEAKIKLAILGSITTQQLREFIELYLYAGGVVADVYEAEYDVFRQEILDPDSGLYSFAPKIIFIATTWRCLSNLPDLNDTEQKVSQLVETELALWRQLWEKAHQTLGCQIVQNNFEQPPWRILGNHERRHSSGLGRFITLVNQAFEDKAPPFVTIHDVDHLASIAGRWKWSDQRVYHYGKLPCGLECISTYAHNIASVILASQGVSKKCLVLDLDNTLWGGVIGDDGLGGIQIGQGDPKGEAYVAFQKYIKSLAQRGVILAVCTKNEDAIAKEVFEKHTEMVLGLEDIACFVANWDDKSVNIRFIAKTLNIGLDSLVFIDDNPAERSLIRRFIPEVSVPELPEDPTGFISAIEKYRYFQMVSLNPEDQKRTAFYRSNVVRKEMLETSENVEDFLQSLQMKARICPIDKMNLERSVQLINKTNQFNLTTRRYSTAEVLEKVSDPLWITLTIALSDCFGDNGLISVLLAKIDGNELYIDTWLMSCRVFKRGVENLLINRLVELVRSKGIKYVRGEYIPTDKNSIVSNLYSSFGFVRTEGKDDVQGYWQLDVDGDIPPMKFFIEEIKADS